MNLKRGEAADALTAWGAILYGLVTILLITPLAGLLTLRLPLYPKELACGLTVFCCMPTTLSSAVSLTQVRYVSLPLTAQVLVEHEVPLLKALASLSADSLLLHADHPDAVSLAQVR